MRSRSCADVNTRSPRISRLLARDALRHRLVLTYQALAEEVSPDTILEQVIAAVPVPQIDLARSTAA